MSKASNDAAPVDTTASPLLLTREDKERLGDAGTRVLQAIDARGLRTYLATIAQAQRVCVHAQQPLSTTSNESSYDLALEAVPLQARDARNVLRDDATTAKSGAVVLQYLAATPLTVPAPYPNTTSDEDQAWRLDFVSPQRCCQPTSQNSRASQHLRRSFQERRRARRRYGTLYACN